MADNFEQTYNYVCFTDLAYEFDFSEKAEIEKKIKRRLKYYKLGDFNQTKVDYIRQLKNDLYNEISLNSKSKYFNKSKSNFTDFNDFNFERLTSDFKVKYDKIEIGELQRMINFSIYLYHLR